jgi:hypothetical protein
VQSSGRMPLPKIRFSSLPRPVWEHILARVEERQISLQDLRRLQDWVNAAPGAPEGDWYKDFGSFMICGSGEFPKTVLTKGHDSIWDSHRIAAIEESPTIRPEAAIRHFRGLMKITGQICLSIGVSVSAL